MITQFSRQGKTAAAYQSIAFISINMTIQVLIALAQNARKSRRTKVFEVLVVISCLKPCVIAYRVLKGGERDPLLSMDPIVESTGGKGAEIVFQSIPASVLQCCIFVSSEVKTIAAMASIFVSVASTGYTYSTISFDFDTSARKRRESPKLYGMVPDEGRGLIFFLMFLRRLSTFWRRCFRPRCLPPQILYGSKFG